jgi:hypothetical protein
MCWPKRAHVLASTGPSQVLAKTCPTAGLSGPMCWPKTSPSAGVNGHKCWPQWLQVLAETSAPAGRKGSVCLPKQSQVLAKISMCQLSTLPRGALGFAVPVEFSMGALLGPSATSRRPRIGRVALLCVPFVLRAPCSPGGSHAPRLAGGRVGGLAVHPGQPAVCVPRAPGNQLFVRRAPRVTTRAPQVSPVQAAMHTDDEHGDASRSCGPAVRQIGPAAEVVETVAGIRHVLPVLWSYGRSGRTRR